MAVAASRAPASPFGVTEPPDFEHTPVQVEAAGHASAVPPLHSTGHAADGPHSTIQLALPSHFAVQPPLGHRMVQSLFPVHDSVDPAPSVMAHALPPAHVTSLFVPVASVHWLVPAQLEVQSAAQLPEHVDFPSHVDVHPVPHVRLHCPFASQWYATPLGGDPTATNAPSAPRSPPVFAGSIPNVHVPPVLHEHAPPLHRQSPAQVAVPVIGPSDEAHPGVNAKRTAASDVPAAERPRRGRERMPVRGTSAAKL